MKATDQVLELEKKADFELLSVLPAQLGSRIQRTQVEKTSIFDIFMELRLLSRRLRHERKGLNR